MATPTRIIMLGTGDFALPTFVHLCESGREVITLITQPDRPQGRKQALIPSRIKVEAIKRGVPVYQPEDVNTDDSVKAVRTLRPDLLVTAAYGQILSAELLGVPRLGGINLHGSVLPAYRGAAPVARAIERGETETGVTVILMNPRVDVRRHGPRRDDSDRAGRDCRRARRPARGARCSARRQDGRRTRVGDRPRAASGPLESHQGPQAPQGRRTDRLVEARSRGAQPRAGHAALADRPHLRPADLSAPTTSRFD